MTSRYADTVKDQYARPIPGALVYVYIWDLLSSTASALEALTTDTATSLSNPLTTDPFGGFYFNAPNGAKLIEVHFAGKLQYREQIQVGPIPSGPPGGPGALFGLFTNLINITAGGATLIASSGYSVVDKGAAVYVYDAAVNSAYVAANPRSSGITADGKGFRLSPEQTVINTMFGAANDGSDDTAANVAMAGFLANNASAIRIFSSGAPQGAAVADSNLTIGQLVNIYVTGGVTHMRLADATVSEPAHAFAPEAVTSGQTGLWSRRGVIPNTGSTTFAAALWLSETVPGGFQSTAPATAGNISQLIGMVLPGFGVEFNPQPEIQL